MIAGRAWWRAGVDTVVLLAVLCLAVTPLQPVFGARAMVPAVVAGLALGTTTVLLAAWRRWRPVVTASIVIVAGAVLAAPIVGAPRVAGIVPTGAALRRIVIGSVGVWRDVLTLEPPLGRGDVLLAPYLLALIGSALAVGIAVGSRRAGAAAFAAVVPMLVLGVCVLLGSAPPALPPGPVGAVAGTVLLVWAAVRVGTASRHRLVAASVLTVVALVGGSALTPVALTGTTRYVLRDHLSPPFDPQSYPSPLAAFRSYVKQGNAVLFSVRGLPDGARVRLAVFDRYDGSVWNVAGGHAAQGSGEFRRVGDTVATTTSGSAAQVTFTVKALTGVWLPTVGSATSFRADSSTAQQLRYNDATGAAVVTGGLSSGTTYTEDAVVPPSDVSDDAIGDAASDGVVLPNDTGVPSDLVDKAATVARDAGTPVQVARSLANWLVQNGYFSHGLADAGDYPSLAGHGAARMSELIDTSPMVGDGEQYASALALMARAMKLKARVVLGFVAGSGDVASASQATTGTGTIDVRGKDVQAWVEVAFAGHGWVTIDATPPTTRTPDQQKNQAQAAAKPQVRQPPTAVQPPVTAPDTSAEQPHTDDPRTRHDVALWVRIARWTGIGLGVLALIAAPALLVIGLKVRRRRRRRGDPVPATAFAGGWAEVVDTARDLREPPPPVATRREAARDLAIRLPLVGSCADDAARAAIGDELDALAVRADRAVFSPGEPSPEDVTLYWADVDRTVRTLRHGVSWRSRWRGRVSTRSLRTRTRRPLRRRRAEGGRRS